MAYKIWNNCEEQYIIDNYEIMTIEEIASFLKRSKDSVFKKAKRLGLTEEIKNWTYEEEQFLVEKWGKISKYHIAKKINKSVLAVRKKAMFFDLGPERIANGEYLTTGDVEYILGIDAATIYRWIQEDFIKSKLIGKKKINQIKPKNLLKFLEENQSKWDSKKAKLNFIKAYFGCENRVYRNGELEIVPTVPKWFLLKIESDKR